MGELVDGVWHPGGRRTDGKGRLVRRESAFRDRITADGASGYRCAAGRYHLYVSLACPWAHRTVIARRLKKLDGAVTLSVVEPEMGADGWSFGSAGSAFADPLFGARRLHEIYTRADPSYSGRVTVPVLWDRERGTIVNNESAEILRMFNEGFPGIAADEPDLYPEPLRAEIDAVNERVFQDINAGVYRAGFATEQTAYDEAFDRLFTALDWIEARLQARRYLCGAVLTEADWRLFTTLIRFDAVYFGHFKCNLRRIADYAVLLDYLRELYQIPGVAETCDFDQIKRHYYWSHEDINPTRIVPRGPALSFSAPHARAGPEGGPGRATG